MDILHKTQKQHLPLILFFSTLNATLERKKKRLIQKRELTSNSIFFPIQLFKQSQRGKKKEEISLNNKTFAFNHHFCRENVWIINQVICFSSSGVFFLSEFCSFNKRKVLKWQAFSQIFATPRWQNEKDAIFGEKKNWYLWSSLRELLVGASSSYNATPKIVQRRTRAIFLFNSAAFNFFLVSFFFGFMFFTHCQKCHQKCLMSYFEIACVTIFPKMLCESVLSPHGFHQ